MDNPKEKRKHRRIKTENLVSYTCFDEDGNELNQGIGRALDISQGGLLVESHTPIERGKILLTSVDVKNELMEINGEVVHCRETEIGVFKAGIRFLEDDQKIRQIVINLVKVYNLQKNR